LGDEASIRILAFAICLRHDSGLVDHDVCSLSIERADEFFAQLKLSDFQQRLPGNHPGDSRSIEISEECRTRYLTLNRESGVERGEARIRLATQIGAGWWACFIFWMNPALACTSAITSALKRSKACGPRQLGPGREHDEDTFGAPITSSTSVPARECGWRASRPGPRGSDGESSFADGKVFDR
jgi:hypothetical protein